MIDLSIVYKLTSKETRVVNRSINLKRDLIKIYNILLTFNLSNRELNEFIHVPSDEFLGLSLKEYAIEEPGATRDIIHHLKTMQLEK
jgi:hypothetical protein